MIFLLIFNPAHPYYFSSRSICPAREDVETNFIDTSDYSKDKLQMAATRWDSSSEARLAPPQGFSQEQEQGKQVSTLSRTTASHTQYKDTYGQRKSFIKKKS